MTGAYVTQNSNGCVWLTERDETGTWRDSYLGRRVDLDEIHDLQHWCSEHGVAFFYTQEALAAMNRTRSEHSRAGDVRTLAARQRNAPSGHRTKGEGLFPSSRSVTAPEQREFATV